MDIEKFREILNIDDDHFNGARFMELSSNTEGASSSLSSKEDDEWKSFSSTKPVIEIIPADAPKEPKPDDWLDDSWRGDYHDLRNLLRNKTRPDMLEFLKKNQGKIPQMREHLLICASYNNELSEICVRLILMLTRCIMGDFETDLEGPEWFDLDLICASDEDEDEVEVEDKVEDDSE